MTSPSLPILESMTLSSMLPQKGHFMTAARDSWLIYWKLIAERPDLQAGSIQNGITVPVSDDSRDDICDLIHLGHAHSPGRNARGTQPDTTCYGCRLLIIRDAVFIHGDSGFVQSLFGVLTGNIQRAEIYKHQMVVSSAGDNGEPLIRESLCEPLGICNDLLLITLERR